MAVLLIMALLGGLYSFFGPALGAAVLYTLQVGINQYTEYWPVVLGIILLIILMFLPDGIIGLAQKLRSQFSRKA